MNELRQVACRGCGLLVSWVTIAATGKRMPLNPVADNQAGRVFCFQGKWQVTSRHVRPPVATALYVPHFVTCVNAAAFRKGRRGQ